MARVLVIHPSPLVRASHKTLLQACGWSVCEAAGRSDALRRLASPASQSFGDMVLVDLSHWTVPGTALIRALRRQAANCLPVTALLPLCADPEQVAQAARRAGANLVLDGNASPHMLAGAVSWMTGQRLPGLARVAVHAQGRELSLSDVWHQQQALVSLPDHAAATVVAARQVFELLLSRREDAVAIDAAMSLCSLAGGPVPLRRWACTYDPSLAPTAPHRGQSPRPDALRAMLVVEAGGHAYGLPMDGNVTPTRWWDDGTPQSAGAAQALAATPLVRLLGPSGFRRLLATDRATVMLGHGGDLAGSEAALRVDDLLGLQHLAVTAYSDTVQRASGCQGTSHSSDGQAVMVLDGNAIWRHLAPAKHRDAAEPQ